MDYNELNSLLSKLEEPNKELETEKPKIDTFFSRDLEIKQFFKQESKNMFKVENENKKDHELTTQYNKKVNEYREHQYNSPRPQYFDIREMNMQINKNKDKKK